MTRLDWSSAPRRYEAGVDRGVLYPPSGPGVPWNGLVTVEESHTGGQVDSYYFDGVKYLEKQSPKNFQATITAFSAPKEFSQCMGELPVIPGFILTRQPRKQFGFSYRTLIEDGDDYKIHIVYNATASPESRGYATIDGSAFATSFSWKIDAVPPKVAGYRPSAHFTLDTTKTDLFTLRAIEDILYGTATSEPRLPSVEELVDIVGLWDPKLIVPAVEPQETKENLVVDPNTTSTALYPARAVTRSVSTDWSASGDTSIKIVNPTQIDAGVTIGGDVGAIRAGMQPGKTYTVAGTVHVPQPLSGTIDTRAAGITVYTKAPSDNGGNYRGIIAPGAPKAGGTARLSQTFTIPVDATEAFIRLYHGGTTPGEVVYWSALSIVEGTQLLPHIHGDLEDDAAFDYAWLGVPNNSKSIRSTKAAAYLTPGLGDLTPSRTPGIYRDLPTTRLAETAVGGLYRLE